MSSDFTRGEVLARLHKQMDAGQSLLVVGAGNGLVARCVDDAGADLIVVYNSGYFRLDGHVSMIGNLPVGDANAIMLELGERHVIPAVRHTPVIGGVYAADPTRNKARLMRMMQAIGYAGVINFPTIGRIDGRYRQELEAQGISFQREVEMVRLARENDYFSMAYVYSPDDAAAMAEAGADVIIGHVGLTVGGDVGSNLAMRLDEAVESLKAMFAAAKAVRSDVILLSHGGPISSPQDAELVNLRTGAAGFVGASSVERIPVEVALKEVCRQFKAIKVQS
jgi:predicted TIM-barrel enzyme